MLHVGTSVRKRVTRAAHVLSVAKSIRAVAVPLVGRNVPQKVIQALLVQLAAESQPQVEAKLVGQNAQPKATRAQPAMDVAAPIDIFCSKPVDS